MFDSGLSENELTDLGENSSQLVLFVDAFFPSVPINRHDHEGIETDHFVPHHLFYCHDRTSHHFRNDTNLSSSCCCSLSFVNKLQRFLNSSPWGSKPPLDWSDPFPDWCWSTSATSLSSTNTRGADGCWCQSDNVISKTRVRLQPETLCHLQFVSIRIFNRKETEQDIFVSCSILIMQFQSITDRFLITDWAPNMLYKYCRNAELDLYLWHYSSNF